MNIEIGKKYQTRDGRPVRVLCVDAPGSQPVIALVGGESYASHFHSDGAYYLHRSKCEHDLIPVPEKVEVDVWVNVYPTGPGTTYPKEREAEERASLGVVARLHIQREVEIGEGLTDEERARLKV